jgi:hypothetical protein
VFADVRDVECIAVRETRRTTGSALWQCKGNAPTEKGADVSVGSASTATRETKFRLYKMMVEYEIVQIVQQEFGSAPGYSGMLGDPQPLLKLKMHVVKSVRRRHGHGAMMSAHAMTR